MPIYEYKCTECNEHFEVMQKITDDPLTTCSSCGGELKKLITSTSFVLKGSGWYVTDYPSSERKKAMEDKKPAGNGKKSDGSDKSPTSGEKSSGTKSAANA